MATLSAKFALNTSLKDLSIALNNHVLHGLLSFLSSLPIAVLCNFMFFLPCVSYAFVRVCLFVPCGHLLGKG